MVAVRLGEEARFLVYYEGRENGLDVHCEIEMSRVNTRFWPEKNLEQLEDGLGKLKWRRWYEGKERDSGLYLILMSKR